MERRLAQALSSKREDIARAWATRVKPSSEQYRRRPLAEIEATGLRFVDGLVEAVTLGDYEGIRACVADIARIRSAQGFGPAELQRAVLLGCDAIYPALEEAFGTEARVLVWAVTQVEKVIHRSLSLLNDALHEVTVASMADAVGEAHEARLTAEQRLGAVLNGLGCGAVVVDRSMIVVWVDDRAHSARCGVTQCGEMHECDPRRQGHPCLLSAALETGEIQRCPPAGECDIWLAVPVKNREGEVVEVVGVMGPPHLGDG